MTNDDFSPRQIETLTRIVQRVIDERVPAIIDERVPAIIDERVPKILDQRLEARFFEERAYFKQYFQQEFAELRAMIERIDRRTDEDTRAAGNDIAEIKERLSRLEADFAKVQAAIVH